MAIKGATSRCQRACHQCLLNTLASYLFRSPPNVVHHRGCPLASLHCGCCNPGCPRAPKPYVHPSGQRKAQGSHSRSGGFTAMVCGKLLNTQPGTLYNMHLSVTRSEGGSGSECNMRLDMAVFAWGHMMHEQDASAHLVPSCNAGKGG